MNFFIFWVFVVTVIVALQLMRKQGTGWHVLRGYVAGLLAILLLGIAVIATVMRATQGPESGPILAMRLTAGMATFLALYRALWLGYRMYIYRERNSHGRWGVITIILLVLTLATFLPREEQAVEAEEEQAAPKALPTGPGNQPIAALRSRASPGGFLIL